MLEQILLVNLILLFKNKEYILKVVICVKKKKPAPRDNHILKLVVSPHQLKRLCPSVLVFGLDEKIEITS